MDDTRANPLTEHAHPRVFRSNAYVYPVLSRRAGGISVGINLNPDKACNFKCIYCQVDRQKPAQEQFVAIPRLLDELKLVLGGLTPGGALWQEAEFRALPPEKAKVTDVAFSGDGEPTMFKNFADIVERSVELKEKLGFTEPKVILITNATGLHRPEIRRGLEFMDQHRGEVWTKLDAGTPGYFALINSGKFPFATILNNILDCARRRTIVIQSCFVRVKGRGPSFQQIAAYVSRLKEIVHGGGKISLVQIYTAARDPAFSIISSLPDKDVDAIVARVRRETNLPAAGFYGQVPEGRGLIGDAPRA